MINYIDMVLVRDEEEAWGRVYEAPAWSHIEVGDKVVVMEFGDGKEKTGVVEAVTTINPESDDAEFILACLCQRKPLRRLLARYTKHDIFYADEEQSNDDL